MVVIISIHDSFLADHLRLEALLERLLVNFAWDQHEQGSRLWTELDSGLRGHLEVEGRYIVSELLRVRERDGRLLLQEHRHIRARMSELGNAFRLHTAQLDSLRNFVDELRAHARTEDRLLYQWADARLDERTRAVAIEALAATPTI